MFYSKRFSWTERRFHERRKNVFDSFIWHELIFLQYFPLIPFPITQCFSFIFFPLCAPSLPFLYYNAMKLFFLKSLGKKKICQLALVITSLCHTEESFSILTDYTFWAPQNPQPWGCSGSSLSPPRVTKPVLADRAAVPFFFAPSSHISAAAFLGERNASQNEYSKHSAGFWKLLRIIFFSLSPLHAWLLIP